MVRLPLCISPCRHTESGKWDYSMLGTKDTKRLQNFDGVDWDKDEKKPGRLQGIGQWPGLDGLGIQRRK